MAQLGTKALSRFYLDGRRIEAPIEWRANKVVASFEDSIQPNITTDYFTFVCDEYTLLINWIADNKIFEGVPFSIETYNILRSYNAFDGMVDLTDGAIIDDVNGKIKAKIKKYNGLNQLDDRLKALSLGYLESIGIFTNADYVGLDYVVEKKNNAIDILISSIILYLMAKELYESIKNTAAAIADVSSKIAILPAGSVGAVIYAVAIAIITAAYTAAMLLVVIELANNLLSCFIEPKRTTKTLQLITGLQKISAYLGYTFESNITDLTEICYLPSNNNFDERNKLGFIEKVHGTKTGIPSPSDYGYGCSDFFELCKKTFNAKIAIIGNRLLFYNEDDIMWTKTSTYVLPNTYVANKQYNTEQLVANRIIAFETDIQDEYTIDSFKGTNYEVITTPITVVDKKANMIKNLDNIQLGVCLGVRKTKASDLIEAITRVVSVMDSFTGGNLAGKISDRIGCLKVATNNWSKPKLIRVAGGKMSSSQLTAKYLYHKYYTGKSFVLNNFYGQKYFVNNLKIGFGLEDFVKTINNSYFTTELNEIGKFINIEWFIDSDSANVSYWVRKPYTNNLKETYVEPE